MPEGRLVIIFTSLDICMNKRPKSPVDGPKSPMRVLRALMSVQRAHWRVSRAFLRVPKTHLRVSRAFLRVPRASFRVPRGNLRVPRAKFRVPSRVMFPSTETRRKVGFLHQAEKSQPRSNGRLSQRYLFAFLPFVFLFFTDLISLLRSFVKISRCPPYWSGWF